MQYIRRNAARNRGPHGARPPAAVHRPARRVANRRRGTVAPLLRFRWRHTRWSCHAVPAAVLRGPPGRAAWRRSASPAPETRRVPDKLPGVGPPPAAVFVDAQVETDDFRKPWLAAKSAVQILLHQTAPPDVNDGDAAAGKKNSAASNSRRACRAPRARRARRAVSPRRNRAHAEAAASPETRPAGARRWPRCRSARRSVRGRPEERRAVPVGAAASEWVVGQRGR